jgi:PIN domain nuclease of toxin-antitoxin system
VRLLLDTHIAIWWMEESDELPLALRDQIAASAAAYVSLASAWEVAIKVGAGKLRLPAPFEHGIRASGFTPLPITFAHVDAVARLPRHHDDPFDRMLIAQTLVDRLTLVTRDRRLEPYGVPTLWA